MWSDQCTGVKSQSLFFLVQLQSQARKINKLAGTLNNPHTPHPSLKSLPGPQTQETRHA